METEFSAVRAPAAVVDLDDVFAPEITPADAPPAARAVPSTEFGVAPPSASTTASQAMASSSASSSAAQAAPPAVPVGPAVAVGPAVPVAAAGATNGHPAARTTEANHTTINMDGAAASTTSKMQRRPSEMGQSLYELLRIEKNATNDQIKQAYRKMALKYHPDKNPSDDARDMMRQLNIAYKVLSDQKLRKIYDKYGSDGLELAQLMEQEEVDHSLAKTHPCCRVFLIILGILTLGYFFCCCCWCFNCCCGKGEPCMRNCCGDNVVDMYKQARKEADIMEVRREPERK